MDYGAKISQQGYDVKTCADRYLLYSSAFRTLKIFNTHTVTTTIPTAGNTNTITITHNLGYYAPAIVVYNGSTTLGVGSSYFMSDSYLPLDGVDSTEDGLEIAVNTIKINVTSTFDSGGSAIGDTVYFTVYSFIETFDSYTASIINTSTTSGAASADYGFRISKPGYDVKTCEDVDCIISSSFFTNIVHKKGTDTSGSVSHSLGYIPSFLGFVKYSGNSFLSLANALASVNSSTLDCGLGAGDTLYYIMFKSKLV